MEKTEYIEGLGYIQQNYTTFFIDLWGVVHNGLQLNSGAINVLDNLDKINKRFVLMSNAPRPADSVKKFLSRLKLNPKYFKNIFTSGDASLKSLQENIHGKTFFHLGPERDQDLFRQLKEKKKSNLEQCDFILCTGLFDKKDGFNTKTLRYYKDYLKSANKLTMVCTNPDLVVDRGKKKEYCAGAVAKVFEDLGGKVIYYGKPYPGIYNFCIKKNEKILVIGDNLNTDIMGANKMKLDSLFITGGVHKDEFKSENKLKLINIIKKYKVKINYYQKQLTWD